MFVRRKKLINKLRNSRSGGQCLHVKKQDVGLNSVRNAAWVFGPQSGAKMVAGLDSVCDRIILLISLFWKFPLDIVAWKCKNQGLFVASR